MGEAQAQEPQSGGPERVGKRYRVLGVLGRGGMATVYRAHDESEDREVALKQLDAGSERSEAYRGEMFSREYRTLSQLAHPSVIRVHEYGVSEGLPYYTMELLGGTDLHAAAPVPWREACAYMRDVASSLALLHSRRLLHRDVSPRNVRCADGHAKLIDFGAMVPMGPGHQVVGTPPLVPPESLHRQTLDSRCDLYSLGGTLYWALTGRHAYPARALGELPLIWKQRPAPPSALNPEVPEALDALVLSLLSQTQDARPRSAAEVMERLSVIAGLDDDEHLHVPLSYLTDPSLQGRRAELKRIRAALRASSGGKSRVVCIQGEMGVGRSRLLDAAAVEARLEGARVLRLDASDAAHGDCGLAEALLERSAEILPELEISPRRALEVVDGASPILDRAPRSRLISRTRAMVRRAAANGPVVLAVDDVESLDEASQALLAMLPSAARRRLLLLLSVRTGAQLDVALDAMRVEAELVDLQPLAAEDTEALLGSVFGDVPGVPVVARRVHALSGGNPRGTMELAQHLVDTGKARYELGGWALPAQLGRDDLPSALTEALDARLQALSADERDLAEALVFALEHGIDPMQLAPMTSHGDLARLHAALDGLLALGIVQVERGFYQFANPAHVERLRKLASGARVEAIHCKLAEALRGLGHDGIEVAHCQLLAGEHAAAIDTLMGELAEGSRWATAPGNYAEVLQWAIECCSALERPARERYRLLSELVLVGEHLGVPHMRQHFADLFAQLTQDSGLVAYESLPDDMDAGERLGKALGIAQERYDALPQHERVHAPVDGIRALAMTVRQAAAFGAVGLDHRILSELPSIEPFIPLSPAIESTANHTVPACMHLNAARYEQAFEGYTHTFERLMEPDHAGLDDDYWAWAVNALRYALGQIRAGFGMDEALVFADQLEADEAWAGAADDVRRAYYLRQGRGREAERCRRRMERRRLETGRRPQLVDTSARLELDIAVHAADLMGVRRGMERLREHMALQPGYVPYSHYGPAVYEHLRGNDAAALEHCEKALAMVEPGQHPTWPWIAQTMIEILDGLGRREEAHQRGLLFVQQGLECGLGVMMNQIEVPLAMVEARLGDFDSAVERVDRAIERAVDVGMGGLDHGWPHEYRARLAIMMNDQGTFTRMAAICGRSYRKDEPDSTLVARYEALMAEARQAGIGTPSMIPPPALAGTNTSSWGSTQLYTQLDAETLKERCERALALLMEEGGASAGVLYRVSEGNLVECGREVGDGEVAPELGSFGGMVLGADYADDDMVTATAIDEATVQGQGQDRWLPAVLGYHGPRGFQRTGVVLLRFIDEPRPLSLELVEVIGRMLQTSEGTVTHA